jgi:hypothetical protein
MPLMKVLFSVYCNFWYGRYGTAPYHRLTNTYYCNLTNFGMVDTVPYHTVDKQIMGTDTVPYRR